MSQATVRKRRRAAMSSDGWCSLNVASRRTGMTRHSLLVNAIAGRFVARVVASMVIIEEASIDRFLAERNGQAAQSDVPAPTA
jgi:hypothetical protein